MIMIDMDSHLPGVISLSTNCITPPARAKAVIKKLRKMAQFAQPIFYK